MGKKTTHTGKKIILRQFSGGKTVALQLAVSMPCLDYQQWHWLLQHLQINCKLLLLSFICYYFSLQKSLKLGEMRRPAWEDSYRHINMSASVTLVIDGEEVLTLQWVCKAKQKSDIPRICNAEQKGEVLHNWAEHQKEGRGRKSLNLCVPLSSHFQISHPT